MCRFIDPITQVEIASIITNVNRTVTPVMSVLSIHSNSSSPLEHSLIPLQIVALIQTVMLLPMPGLVQFKVAEVGKYCLQSFRSSSVPPGQWGMPSQTSSGLIQSLSLLLHGTVTYVGESLVPHW